MYEIIFTLFRSSIFLDSCALYFLICCSIFKDRAAALFFFASAAGFIFYHIRFCLSRGFLNFFKFFSKSFDSFVSPLLRRPVYYIMSDSVCQYFFQKFFELFFCITPSGSPFGHFPPRLVYYITSSFFCQVPLCRSFSNLSKILLFCKNCDSNSRFLDNNSFFLKFCHIKSVCSVFIRKKSHLAFSKRHILRRRFKFRMII